MRRLIGLVLLVAMLAGLATHSVAVTNNAAPPAVERHDYIKDETVYASLNPDGSIMSVSVVNRIDSASGGIYTDYGTYSTVKNLTNGIKPQIDGNKIIWQLPAHESGFYYEGTLDKSLLPVTLKLAYFLDGQEVQARDLAGKSGKVMIQLMIEWNDQVHDYFKNHFLAQVQVPLSLEKCRNISAQGAQSVIVGSTNTLAFMVMPGKNQDFTITFDAKSFEMDGITATLAPMDIGSLLGMDVGDLKSGTEELSKGTEELVSGTQKLKEGLSGFVDGLMATKEGFSSLQSGSAQLKGGLESYTAGVGAISSNASQLSQGLLQLGQNGTSLSDGFSELSMGTMTLLEGIIAGLPAEQQAILSIQADALKAQLAAYGSNLTAYTQGVSQSAQGMAALAGGLSELARQGGGLVDGAQKLQNGAAEFGKGLNALAEGARPIPHEVQKLADGQKQLVEGIDTALGMAGEFNLETDSPKPVSFVEPTRNINSVQFIMRTPAIAIPEVQTKPKEAEKPQTFWQKLGALFSK